MERGEGGARLVSGESDDLASILECGPCFRVIFTKMC